MILLRLLASVFVTVFLITLMYGFNVVLLYEGDSVPWHTVLDSRDASEFTDVVVKEYPDIWDGI